MRCEPDDPGISLMCNCLLTALLAVPLGATVAFGTAAVKNDKPALTSEMDGHLMQALDDIFRMDFSAAGAEMRKVAELNPDHPYGPLGAAVVTLMRYLYDTEQTDQSLIRPFEEQVQETIHVCKRWLENHPDDPEGLLALGAAYGISSRFLTTRREWIAAYWHGRKAIGYVRRAAKLSPTLNDAYFGIGMYDYYTDVYSRLIKVLTRLLFGGDRLRGISNLKNAAEKGRYSSIVAKLVLVEIYTEDRFGSRDTAEAVRIMEGLRKIYPNSPMFHSAYLISLYEKGEYEKVAQGAGEYLDFVRSGKYRRIDKAKGHVMLGTAWWAMGWKDKALNSFKEASDVSYNGRLSSWAVWALIRAGQLQDVLGMRKEALKSYGRAAREPDDWKLKGRALAGIKAAFSGEHPGPIPPL